MFSRRHLFGLLASTPLVGAAVAKAAVAEDVFVPEIAGPSVVVAGFGYREAVWRFGSDMEAAGVLPGDVIFDTKTNRTLFIGDRYSPHRHVVIEPYAGVPPPGR